MGSSYDLQTGAREGRIERFAPLRRSGYKLYAVISFEMARRFAMRGSTTGRRMTPAISSSPATRLWRSNPQPRQRCTSACSPLRRAKTPMGAIREPQSLPRSPGVVPSTCSEWRQKGQWLRCCPPYCTGPAYKLQWRQRNPSLGLPSMRERRTRRRDCDRPWGRSLKVCDTRVRLSRAPLASGRRGEVEDVGACHRSGLLHVAATPVHGASLRNSNDDTSRQRCCVRETQVSGCAAAMRRRNVDARPRAASPSDRARRRHGGVRQASAFGNAKSYGCRCTPLPMSRWCSRRTLDREGGRSCSGRGQHQDVGCKWHTFLLSRRGLRAIGRSTASAGFYKPGNCDCNSLVRYDERSDEGVPSCAATRAADEKGMPLARDKPKWRNGRRDGLKNRWAARLMWVRLPPSAPISNLTLADAGLRRRSIHSV